MSSSAQNTNGNVAKMRYRWQMVNRLNPKACVVRPAKPDAAKQDLKRFVQDNRLEYRHKQRDDFADFEDLFGQLRLNEDEELLDRAERRDLPASVQLAAQRHGQSQVLRSSPDKPESIIATSSESRRNRAVPNRRSAVPDTLYDDYAYRLYNQGSELRTRKARDSGLSTTSGRDIRRRPIVGRSNSRTPMSTATSYLSLVTYDDCSAAVSRAECNHCEALHTVEEACPLQHLNSCSRLPDLVVDDAFNRTIRQSAAAQVAPPQPPFGIPNSPTSCYIHTCPQSDYLRVEPGQSSQLRYRPREPVPDITYDDLAFRTLRKDFHLGSKLSDRDFWQGQILSRSASTSDLLPFRDMRITLRPIQKPSSSLASSAASNSSTAASPTFDSSSP